MKHGDRYMLLPCEDREKASTTPHEMGVAWQVFLTKVTPKLGSEREAKRVNQVQWGKGRKRGCWTEDLPEGECRRRAGRLESMFGEP